MIYKVKSKKNFCSRALNVFSELTHVYFNKIERSNKKARIRKKLKIAFFKDIFRILSVKIMLFIYSTMLNRILKKEFRFDQIFLCCFYSVWGSWIKINLAQHALFYIWPQLLILLEFLRDKSPMSQRHTGR